MINGDKILGRNQHRMAFVQGTGSLQGQRHHSAAAIAINIICCHISGQKSS
jgi:hypothetical protein